jgi:two-component system LytT family sensor kinase
MKDFRTSSLVSIHCVAWLLFIGFPILFINQGNNSGSGFFAFSWSHFLFPLLYILVFYLNAYYLFPKYYVNKKYLIYALSVLVLLIVVLSIKPFDQLFRSNRREQTIPPPPPRPNSRVTNQPPFNLGNQADPERINRIQPTGRQPGPDEPGDGKHHFDILSFFVFVMVMGMGTALSSIKEWQQTQERAILAEAGRANAELSFLKAQINPHFLYNTLNNIYTLSIMGSEKTSESIMKLSNIMRYITDEAENNYVSLKDEIDCISDFIDLQRLRFGKKVNLNYHISGDPSNHEISPLILMTFIENVFKYGLSNHADAPITINLKIEADKIIFDCQNKIFDNDHYAKRAGVGIKNTKLRLDHLYPNKHSLEISDKNGVFSVKLTLYS